ncbi:universal stress protein [Actinoplanes sp. NPDC023936]|uniref:universal stress protein n=1 Tax=Actinoplanes sp. NPDC023936 TaxID=3154910 RepID=UPI0033E954AD
MPDPVVVGVDGTAPARAAVRLAAREAISRGCVLKVVHAFTWADPGTGYASARGAASRLVEEAVAFAQRSTPGLDARGQLLDGPPARVLIAQSRAADLLVVGGDGLDRLGAGSVVDDLVPRSWCPVALARGQRPPTGPVVAAVDGSEFSLLGLRFAIEEAALRGCPLRVVHVIGAAGRREAADRLLAAVPAEQRRILVGPPAATLIRATRRAGLLVLGPRGAGGARRIGSVAGEVLRRGGCPVVFAHGLPAGSAAPPAVQQTSVGE